MQASQIFCLCYESVVQGDWILKIMPAIGYTMWKVTFKKAVTWSKNGGKYSFIKDPLIPEESIVAVLELYTKGPKDV